jgi:hypothetical protein
MPTEAEPIAALEKYIEDHKKLEHANVHAIRLKLNELDAAVQALQLHLVTLSGESPEK